MRRRSSPTGRALLIKDSPIETRFISGQSTSTSSVTDVDSRSAPSESSADSEAVKKADLAGRHWRLPEWGDPSPQDYNPLMTPKETHKAIFHPRRDIGDNLCRELGLMMVQVPLIVNIMLDRDGSAPIQFHICDDREQHPIDTQVVRSPP